MDIFFPVEIFSNWLSFNIFKFDKGSILGEAINYFIYDSIKILLLLCTIIYLVSIIRTFLHPQKIKKFLSNRFEIVGNFLAALIGTVTPFCSCSAIPLFLGFVEAGVPLGVTFSFLISAPMINEVAVVLLYGMFGWQTALIYVGTGLFIAITAGWIIGKLKLEKWVEPWVYEVKVGKNELGEEKINFSDRIKLGYDAVKEKRGWLLWLAGGEKGGRE